MEESERYAGSQKPYNRGAGVSAGADQFNSPVGGVLSQVGNFRHEVELSEALVSNLEDRLSTVTRPPKPEPTRPPGTAQVERSPQCSLEEEIYTLRQRVSTINARLSTLLSRIEL